VADELKLNFKLLDGEDAVFISDADLQPFPLGKIHGSKLENSKHQSLTFNLIHNFLFQ